MKKKNPPKFIDVFAGCGGLSLGLINAGWHGRFAIEKSPLAFSTLQHNLLGAKKNHFDWPTWLPKEATTIEEALANHADNLGKMGGRVDLIVGGPPCQGFSVAGKRDPNDPRNKLTEQYLSLVGLVKPRFLVIENVSGFDMSFDANVEAPAKRNGKKESYANYVANRLAAMGYRVYKGLINCADFGVPQNRLRFLMLCELNVPNVKHVDLFDKLRNHRARFLRSRRLPLDRQVAVAEAIGDLETAGCKLLPASDSPAPGFMEAEYQTPKNPNAYLTLMRRGMQQLAPNSRRLANHRPETIKKFRLTQVVCEPGHCLSVSQRKLLGTQKHARTVLNRTMPSATVTTLPDDILHYSEPRILTVRENARLQSFPDWFAFQGKYTTGGSSRKNECPRYTQVGNAVPPLLAEAIGEVLQKRIAELKREQRAKNPHGTIAEKMTG
ncbi:DNA (cytosine-5-)-methyltransferase [Cupriavidus sp. USMAA2-4]|uniref:DNA cytosine methyltransferase n=1 Tax=Cupriavidus sp. USMAA2-4 TaxID=876364 RepID=UPI0008A69DCD|nr:DNA cytosine methyltransferase [Cupriavidus sp. USMAA2-4]AOY92167.1 DNA (cytosine-5-)-methyltransferase [Cupriavidus sp. USMAA2-4]